MPIPDTFPLEDQTYLLGVFGAFMTARSNLLQDEKQLDNYLRSHAQGAAYEFPDLFGDGLLKPADELTIFGGRQPNIMAERKAAAKAARKIAPLKGSKKGKNNPHQPGTAAARRRPQAPVTVDHMNAAELKLIAAQMSRGAYQNTALVLAAKFNNLAAPDGMPAGMSYDVFGDRTIKRSRTITMPEPLIWYSEWRHTKANRLRAWLMPQEGDEYLREASIMPLEVPAGTDPAPLWYAWGAGIGLGMAAVRILMELL